MRMSEQPSVDVEMYIAAAPQHVWSLATDLVLMGQWSPEYQGGEWLDGATGPLVGARFKGRNKRQEREWESVSTITAAEPGKVFAWAVSDPKNPAASWRLTMAPEGSGTRVVHHVTMGPGPSGLTAAIAQRPEREEAIVAARVTEHRRNMQATLEGLKKAAEQEG